MQAILKKHWFDTILMGVFCYSSRDWFLSLVGQEKDVSIEIKDSTTIKCIENETKTFELNGVDIQKRKTELLSIAKTLVPQKHVDLNWHCEDVGGAYAHWNPIKGDQIFLHVSMAQPNSHKEINAVFVHELAHVHYNDYIFSKIINILTISLFPCVLFVNKRFVIPYIALYFFGLANSRIQETRADRFAIEKGYASDLLKYFTQEQQQDISNKQKWKDVPITACLTDPNKLSGKIQSLFIKSNGDFLLDIQHPALSKRVEACSKWIEEQNKIMPEKK